jgi:hypothetical protein
MLVYVSVHFYMLQVSCVYVRACVLRDSLCAEDVCVGLARTMYIQRIYGKYARWFPC